MKFWIYNCFSDTDLWQSWLVITKLKIDILLSHTIAGILSRIYYIIFTELLNHKSGF